MISMQQTYGRVPATLSPFAPSPAPFFDVSSQSIAPTKRLTMAAIRACVEDFYGMEPGAIGIRDRTRKIARARQVAMYLTRIMTRQSYPTIALRFGGFDHTTVLHAVRQIERLVETDADFAEEVETMRRRIVGL